VKTILFVGGIILMLLLLPMSSNPTVLAQESEGQPNTHVLNSKGIVKEDGPFAGQVVWTMINEDSGTIVHSTSEGIVVIRLAIEKSNECVDGSDQICLDATVTSVKNTDMHDQGDSLQIIYESPEKVTISVVTGSMADTVVNISLTKIRVSEVEQDEEPEATTEGQNITISLSEAMNMGTG